MREAIKPATMFAGIAAISLLALGFVPAPAFAQPTCTFTPISGIFATRSGTIGTWSQSGTIAFAVQKGTLIQGAFTGSFANSLGFSPSVTGVFSLDTSTGNLLMKVTGATFAIDYAFLDLPTTPAFAFQGVLHIVGEMPIPMVELVSPPVVPVSCT